MKIIKFLFQIGLLIFLCAVVFLGTVTGLLLYKPNIIINPFVLNFVGEKVSLNNYVAWKDIKTSIEKRPDWRYVLSVSMKDVCLNFDAAKGCIKYLSITSDLSLPIRQAFKINAIGPAVISGVDMRLNEADSTPEAAVTNNYVGMLRDFLDIHYESIKVGLDRLKISPADKTKPQIVLTGDLEFSGFSNNLTSMVNINVKQLGNMDWRQLVAVVEIGGVSKNTLLRDLTLKVDLKASHKNGYVNLTGNLEAPNAEGQRNNNFTIFYNVAGDKLVLNSGGVLTKTFWQSTVDLNMKTLANQIVGISLDPCHLTMNFVDESPLNGFNTDLSCRGQGRRQHLSSENIIGLFIPQKIRFDLNGAIAFHKAEERNLLETHLSLSIDRIASDLYHMDGQVLLDGTVDLDEGKNSNHEAKFAIGFEIPDFQKVVHKLATTNISIPAPLNQLKGSASCDANGRFRTVQSLNQFPIFCQSQLASAEQKVNLKITSNLELKKLTSSYRPHLDGDILVDDVLFTMPDIDIRKPIPQIFPDKRFVTLDDLAKEGIKNSKPDPISYNFRVHTSEDRPLRFKTELLPNVIPISLDLKLKDDSKMQGVVAVHDYQITLFKRTAQIENIEVVFAANREIQDIKGRIRFPNKDYFLGMDIYGTLQEPSYNFFSNPPLDSNQILGLLLFGEDPSNLDDETQRSIGNTQTAMADKAVGLLSMYYLASTPIERLGYDSNAQVFTAQFRLVDGVRLTLGSDAGSKGTVGLRKKLKGNWSIETTAERDSDTDAQKGRASLNWSKRF